MLSKVNFEENQHLLQPLIYPPTSVTAAAAAAATSVVVVPTTTKPRGHNDIKDDQESNSSIIVRLVLIAFVGIVAVWANNEASKGFAITIINEADINTVQAKRFSLFYISNDEATRIVIKTSKLVGNFLYPNEMYKKKKVNSLTFKLASRNLSTPVVVDSGKDAEFVIHLSPSIMEEQNFKLAMLLAIQQGVICIWLWDGQGNAPRSLMNGIVEYIASNLGTSSTELNVDPVEPQAFASTYWNHENVRLVAGFLNYCERVRPGFIRRLNQAMKDGWHEEKLDDALGMPIQHLCTKYNCSSSLDY